MRLLTLALTLGLMLIGWSGPWVALAAVQKVDVCHREGNGSYHTISVAAQAVSAHRAHGDALAGEAIPGVPGYRFDDNCAPVAASICPCDFSAGGLAVLGIDASTMGGGFCRITTAPEGIGVTIGGAPFALGADSFNGAGRCSILHLTPNLIVVADVQGLPLDVGRACMADLLNVAPALDLTCQ